MRLHELVSKIGFHPKNNHKNDLLQVTTTPETRDTIEQTQGQRNLRYAVDRLFANEASKNNPNFSSLRTNLSLARSRYAVLTANEDTIAFDVKLSEAGIDRVKTKLGDLNNSDNIIALQKQGIQKTWDFFRYGFGYTHTAAGKQFQITLPEGIATAYVCFGIKNFNGNGIRGYKELLADSIRIEVPRTAETETIADSIEQALQKLDVQDVLQPATDEEFIAHSYREQHKQDDTATIPDSISIKPAYGDYEVAYDAGALARYKEAAGGEILLLHSFNPQDISGILGGEKGNGLVSLLFRKRMGIPSVGYENNTGGEDTVFMRAIVPSALEPAPNETSYIRQIRTLYYRFSEFLIIDPSELNRTDWRAYLSDKGGSGIQEDLAARPTPEEFFREMKEKSFGRSSTQTNEIMMPVGISLNAIKGIAVREAYERERLIEDLHNHGINRIRDIDVEDFIRVHTTLESLAKAEGLIPTTNLHKNE